MQAKYVYNSRANRYSCTTGTVPKWRGADCEKRFERPGAVKVGSCWKLISNTQNMTR